MIRKTMICGSSHILKINLQNSDSNFFRKMNPYQNSRYLEVV
ncbi:hypothetical protein LEP1GSC132_2415 [Leptospira kirschneri str. 200803703]|uniref:Uncharacterized protein n=1 Tax=Leptospira kirschneri str. 200802841 TaxID=1193047 RepID=A0A828Y311_9LEPT|nr:hypothetical protein LEP1GSC044_0086 [Leptospira kirschneri serovar Grippotyphosa str. RM52]EKO51884.1 hypothetical protein LEP1GSC131_1461 [Leptospira kirschneri str. 200802841]EKP04680.1 hypothetical protein LEP1GSC018_1324 [Leptospira kirschneri str. 2008720114]EKQ83289.1 hypothetical protein LEP1GSC064_1087 [Leptospira kirschneri serovar Grippotyphosa str. Moskva]EKR07890.1 hypothetical protein LEP1GSC122_2330 [Leptospira kirschneri serovar Valbuzzi str. 200702274]EMJ85419.1 hypothetica